MRTFLQVHNISGELLFDSAETSLWLLVQCCMYRCLTVWFVLWYSDMIGPFRLLSCPAVFCEHHRWVPVLLGRFDFFFCLGDHMLPPLLPYATLLPWQLPVADSWTPSTNCCYHSFPITGVSIILLLMGLWRQLPWASAGFMSTFMSSRKQGTLFLFYSLSDTIEKPLP